MHGPAHDSVATVAAVTSSGVNFHHVAWLPPQVQDLDIGIVALAVNVVVLIVVSFGMRLAAAPPAAPLREHSAEPLLGLQTECVP